MFFFFFFLFAAHHLQSVEKEIQFFAALYCHLFSTPSWSGGRIISFNQVCFSEIVLLVLQLQVELRTSPFRDCHFRTSGQQVEFLIRLQRWRRGEVEDECRERKDAALCCNELVGVCHSLRSVGEAKLITARAAPHCYATRTRCLFSFFPFFSFSFFLLQTPGSNHLLLSERLRVDTVSFSRDAWKTEGNDCIVAF